MKQVSFLSILILALFGCRNDIDDMGGSSTMIEPPIIIEDYNPEQDLVEGTIFGRVYDEQENPVADAQVTYDGKNYSTDEEGRFFIIDETLNKQGTFFTVVADGYFKGSRRLNPQDGSVNYANVQLLALNTIGTFNTADGGQIDGDDGISLTFVPNSIISSDGTLYDGEVSVAVKFLDPTAPNIGEIMPGNLLGLSSEIEEVSLVSYGMMAAELFGENGEKLNIAEGQTARLSFPVPVELLGSAPEEIPLWSFEEEQYGIWAEEGTATLQNGKYVGDVSHFSFWNCDAPFELVFIEGQLIGPNGNTLPNVNVGIFAENNTGFRYSQTDNRGFFAGKVPKGIDLNLVARYQGQDCEFNNIKLGSFNSDENLGPIQLEETNNSFNIKGSIVDCNNNPLTNGLINLSIGQTNVNIYLRNENTFETTLLNCEGVNSVDIKFINLDSLSESAVQSFPISEEVNTGPIMACQQAVTEFIILEFLGIADTTLNGPRIRAQPLINEQYLLSTPNQTSENERIRILTTMDNLEVGTYENEGLDIVDNFGDENPWDMRCFIWFSSIKEFTLDITQNDDSIGGLFAGKLEGIIDLKCLNPASPTTLETIEDEYFKIEFQLVIE